MVVFTFVNSGNAGGYCVASDRATMGWRELPHDLDREMEDVREKGEEVEEVSIGLDGDWFLRTDSRHACKTEHGNKDMISNVELFVQLIQEAGLTLADYAIQFFTFVPDPTGYVTVLHKTDRSLTRCAWHNVPAELDALLETEAPKGVRHVTVGVNGSYVLILNSGLVWWGSGVPVQLQRLLEDAERRGRPVATVSLSLISPSWYFIEFADGATQFFLPPVWHNSINNYAAHAMRARGPKMATSYHPGAPSPRAPGYPLHGQYGSFSPVNFHGGGINPGYIPFASNPNLASAFTGVPQQPVYNITHVYNSPMPQQQQQHQEQQHESSSLQKYNGMFSLLGGTLKLAGAVLGASLANDPTGFSF